MQGRPLSYRKRNGEGVIVHYDNGTTFCDAQERLGARGLVTRDEQRVSCPHCLERFGRIEDFQARVLGRYDRERERARTVDGIDWFGDG